MVLEEGSDVEVESGIAGEKSGTDGGSTGGDKEASSRCRLEGEISDKPSENSCGFCETCDHTSLTAATQTALSPELGWVSEAAESTCDWKCLCGLESRSSVGKESTRVSIVMIPVVDVSRVSASSTKLGERSVGSRKKNLAVMSYVLQWSGEQGSAMGLVIVAGLGSANVADLGFQW